MRVLKEQGAELFELPDGLSSTPYQQPSRIVSQYDFKAEINEYLGRIPKGHPVRSLTELIAFNEQNRERELQYYGQENWISALKAGERSEQKYKDARAEALRLSAKSIDDVLA
jgi:amidase